MVTYGRTNAMTAGGGTPTPTPTQTKEVQATAFPTVVTPDEGYTLSQATVTAPANLSAENIKKDVTIAGVTGSFEGTEVQVSDHDGEICKNLIMGTYKSNDTPLNLPNGFEHVTKLGDNALQNVIVGPEGIDISNCTYGTQCCYRIKQSVDQGSNVFTGGSIKVSGTLGSYCFYYAMLKALPEGNWKLSDNCFAYVAFYGIDKLEITESMIPDNGTLNSCFSNLQFGTGTWWTGGFKDPYIILPANVRTITGYGCVSGTNSNKITIKMLGSSPPSLSASYAIGYVSKIIVPVGSLETYQTATNWSQFADIMEEATE